MATDPLCYELAHRGLALAVREAPWDSAVFGFPVVDLYRLELREATAAVAGFAWFLGWLDARGVGAVCCRLGADRMVESMFLEAQGFRVVEMVLHPVIELDGGDLATADLEICHDADPAVAGAMARSSFRHERFHSDPRFDRAAANERYGRWVEGVASSSTQRLTVLRDGTLDVAFFLWQAEGDQVYWHLTAVAPACQGRGYGLRAWRTMLALHRSDGARRVSTTISARNVEVLGLYGRLGARYRPPELSLHWVAGR